MGRHRGRRASTNCLAATPWRGATCGAGAAIRLGADHDLAKLTNLHTFHILQTVSENSIGLDVGIPARGLHGEAYRGHVFWDELFVFPFLTLRFPGVGPVAPALPLPPP